MSVLLYAFSLPLCPGPVRVKGEVNVLLIGSGDPRHILKTIAGLQDEESLHVSLSHLNCHVTPENKLLYFIASCKRLLSAPLQVWVIENSMEEVARQLLLLYLALMPQESMGRNGGWDFVNSFINVQ